MAITTGKCRASFVHIFQPRIPENGGEAKYSITLLIPKTDTATINAIYADIERAKQEGAQKFGGSIPPQCKIPIYDGDGYRPSGELFGEECHGCMVITATAKNKPVIVGTDYTQELINPADVYSGCYVRANINMFAYNSNGSKGIGCGLNCVQKVEDGEPLAVRVSAAEAFGGANTYAGAAAPQAGVPAGAYGYPQQMPAYTPPATYPAAAPQAPAYPGAVANGFIPQYAQGAPVQPAAPYPAGAVDPITGKPMVNGVLGV